MKLYKLALTVKSTLGTTLAADTLFGHICWSIRYHQGEQHLCDFLSQMQSDSPPLIISDPFPAQYLPVPVMTGLDASSRKKLTAKLADIKDKRDAFDRLKKLSKTQWISVGIYGKLCCNMSISNVVEQLLNQQHSEPSFPSSALSPHNAVDRMGGGTIEGAVFFTEDAFVNSSGMSYEIYIQSEIYPSNQIHQLFNEALENGYGRDKTTGKGVIEVGDITELSLPVADAPNGVMLLGPCVPQENDPTEGYWNIKGKAGKLGGHWAISENPHKKPVMMLQTGSVLLTDHPRPFYGRMVPDIHPEIDSVLHYGYAPALPVRLNLNAMEVVA